MQFCSKPWLLICVSCALLVAVLAKPAKGCAVCACGDPTLTTAGTEQPFAGRLRSAIELRYRADSLGRPEIDESSLREWRVTVSTAWAPRADLFLVAEVPLSYRQVTDVTLAQNDVWGLGEIALSAKWFIFRDRELAPRWLVALHGGLKLPTAPWHEDSSGDYLPLEAQPGSGSLDVSFGPSLAVFRGALSAYSSLYWVEPVLTRSLLAPGRSLRSSTALQYQLFDSLAGRLAGDLRWDQSSEEERRPDPNSGGWIAFVGGDVLLSPVTDSAIVLGVRLPALNRLHGAHDEGPVFSLAFVQDW